MPSVPERVLSLIDGSGMTRREFGQRVGLDESKLSKSLSGTRRFSSVDLARIAEFCQVTVDWLLTGEEPALAVAARTTGGNARTALEVAERYRGLRTDIAWLGYPQPWRPVSVRTVLGSPAGGSPNLAAHVEERFGVDVTAVDLGPDFDGLAVSSDDVKLIVLATSHLPARQRFTLAHELGHLLYGDDQGIHLDHDIFDRARERDPSERRANEFAAAFLMPEDTLRDAAGSTGLTEEAFAALACALMVTPRALAIRLLRLRLIDSGTCDRLKTITASRAATMAGRGNEFAAQVTEASLPRPPGLLVRDTYAAYESGAATLRPYANLIGAEVEELERSLESEHGSAP